MATDRSFLTDFDTSARKKASAVDRAADYNQQLLDRVDGLKDFIDELLRRQERDYLKATRTQMSQLALEISHLKKEAGKRDQEAEILKLKEAVNWIREEAVKLDGACKKLRTDLLHWKVKASALEDDRNFLEKQLKQVLRDRFTPVPSQTDSAFLPPLVKKPVYEPRKLTLPNTKAGQYLTKLLLTYSADDPALFSELEQHLTAQESQYQASLVHYRRTLATEKRRLQSVNSTFSTALSTRSELEDVFFECVKSVRLEVHRRREQAGHHRSQSQGPEPDQLAAADKRKVLELLVENEAVLSKVYETLFPHRKKEPDREGDDYLNVAA